MVDSEVTERTTTFRGMKLWVVIFVLLSVAFSLAGVEYVHYIREKLTTEGYSDLASVGTLKSQGISTWRTERLNDAETFARVPAFAIFLEQPDGQESIRDSALTMLHAIHRHLGYANAALLNGDFEVALSGNEEEVPILENTIATARMTLEEGGPHASPLQKCPVLGHAVAEFMAPVKNREGETVGVLVLREDARTFLYPNLASWPFPSKSGESVLVRKDGDLVLFLNDLKYQKDTALSLTSPVSDPDLPAALAIRGETGKWEGRDYRDVEVLADLRPVPGTPWFLVSKLDTDEIGGEIRYRSTATMAFVLLFIFLTGFVFLLVYHRKSRSEYRQRYLLEREKRAEQEMFRTTLYSIGDGVITTEPTGRVLHMNAVAEGMTGWTEAQAQGVRIEEVFKIINEETLEPVENPVDKVLREGRIVGLANHTLLVARDGSQRAIADSGAPIRLDNELRGVVLVFQDQTEQRLAQKEMLERATELAWLINSMTNAFVVFESVFDEKGKLTDARFEYVNESFWKSTGKTLEEVIGQELSDVWPAIGEEWLYYFEKVVNSGEALVTDLCHGPTRKVFHCRIYRPWESNERFCMVFDDITEQRNIQEETRKLELQLQQAMKMEAIGRLAGGIAHDFNNLLTGITGTLSLVQMDLPEGSPISDSLDEIGRAAHKAAELTAQLLAFSRKQHVEPRVVEMAALVRDLQTLLQRTLGEDIELTIRAGNPMPGVLVDPGQFEQILVNLAVNSRDAMPNGGKLTIETGLVDLDEEYCRTHPILLPGRHVMLAVSDTGEGIPADVKEHIFEPFYTTKPKGKGTGLGLSTAYGTVRQAGGSIEVYSEVDQGTTFKLYLPVVAEQPNTPPARSKSMDPIPSGSETILLVEDEQMVRDVGVKILRRLGYQVIEACDGLEAEKLFAEDPKRIDLLLTDVVMPGMNGKELATSLSALVPDLKVIFTSGYTENVIAHHGVIDTGLHFVPKPYSPMTLAQKVRQVLDGVD